MEAKQEEQARQMVELRERADRLQQENDRLRTCHAPDPGPTRLANPNRFQGAKPYAGTPYIYIYIYIFLKLNLYLWYTNNFCNNQQSFTFTNELPPEWDPLNVFAHILSPIHLYKYAYIYISNITSEIAEQCW